MIERTIWDHSDPKGERVIRSDRVDTITERRYAELRQYKYAGPLSSLMPATAEQFRAAGATHWRICHTSPPVLSACVVVEDGASWCVLCGAPHRPSSPHPRDPHTDPPWPGNAPD